MAHESFEDDSIAAFLNDHFVSIKVDREERPDVDNIYMRVCQTLTGSGGWPLSIFMDAHKTPFFAGTYFPQEDRGGMVGFPSLLQNIASLWQNKRDDLIKHGEKIVKAIAPEAKTSKAINEKLTLTAFRQLSESFDSVYGGFGNAPKFPTPHNLLFLLKYSVCEQNTRALEICTKTLDSMRSGGIFDHVGFGFSRYSTDRRWLVPHFEKMLYDNALLCLVYTECFSITKDPKYQKTAEEIITYLVRDLRSENGAFYAAEDADSEGVEGKFYCFSKAEIESTLGSQAGEFCQYFNVTEKGNFEGTNILNTIDVGVPENRQEFADTCRQKLFTFRQNRIRPSRDEKILTSYNGLAIAALAMAGKVLEKDEYVSYAMMAARFVLDSLQTREGKLLARYCDGESKYPGSADDYAFFIWGLIELYQATFDESYLQKALSLDRIFIDNFFDPNEGGFFLSDKDAEAMLTRPKEIYDGAMPSANAISVYNNMRLSKLTHDITLTELTTKTLETFMADIEAIPMGHTFSAIDILCHQKGSIDAVLVADHADQLKEMLSILRSKYHPFLNIKVVNSGEQKEHCLIDGLPTVYLCKGFTCMPPVTSALELEKLLS